MLCFAFWYIIDIVPLGVTIFQSNDIFQPLLEISITRERATTGMWLDFKISSLILESYTGERIKSKGITSALLCQKENFCCFFSI